MWMNGWKCGAAGGTRGVRVEGSAYDACIPACPDAQNWTSGCGNGVSGPVQRRYAIVPNGQEPRERSIPLSVNVNAE